MFSACDALAPLIGVWAGNVLGRYIGPVAEYAGAAALGAYALYLVVHALRTEEAGDLDHPLAILGMPLPLSLDNLFAGASLGVVGASPVTVAVVCGCATLIMSAVGLAVGQARGQQGADPHGSVRRPGADGAGRPDGGPGVMNDAAVTRAGRQRRASAVLPLRGAVHVGECRSTHRAGRLRRLPSLQRDACLLHVSEHVLRLRGAPTLKAAITIRRPMSRRVAGAPPAPAASMTSPFLLAVRDGMLPPKLASFASSTNLRIDRPKFGCCAALATTSSSLLAFAAVEPEGGDDLSRHRPPSALTEPSSGTCGEQASAR